MSLLPFALYARSCRGDKMNQYWSLSGPVLVSNSDQYYFVS